MAGAGRVPHLGAWPAGRAYVTLLGHLPVVLWRTEEQTFRVLPRSSFAEHAVRWLLYGMAEFADPAAVAFWR